MDYSQLSDFEINKCVSVAAGLNVNMSFDVDEAYARGPVWTAPSGNFYAGIKSSKGNPFDPCNNPADAWPIISGHKLSIINADDEWLCVPEDTAVDGITGDDVQMIYSGDGHIHTNPLRAAMIVFLMMQDNNHA
ncbi:phage protein NinX family protein [Enterobacter hormaechei]|uniref:phage protein NinX family protein n=1 Tax=Enterobacter hormaechei TaxID=158836 RepID=UPI00202210D9|nr:phage protein NinX family protein [Enterobacter hormaechei]MCL8077211.1 DUF2591 family protein [Enterobacter hormaechei]MCM6986714.1 DUF2591 family protein [Enterobacter hormaechei]MCM7056796.1 DUF2591 family protein [Enterobacter hormaechei]